MPVDYAFTTCIPAVSGYPTGRTYCPRSDPPRDHTEEGARMDENETPVESVEEPTPVETQAEEPEEDDAPEVVAHGDDDTEQLPWCVYNSTN